MVHDLPKLGRQASARIDDQMRKDLNVLCVTWGGTVSDVLRKAVNREAEAVRQAWQAGSEESSDG